jgi:hypothetical protein
VLVSDTDHTSILASTEDVTLADEHTEPPEPPDLLRQHVHEDDLVSIWEGVEQWPIRPN